MDKEAFRNHLWVAKTAVADMVPFSAFFAKNRKGEPLFEFEYEEPVEINNVGYYGNKMRGVATSETFKKLSNMADALTICTLLLGEISLQSAETHNLGLFSMFFAGAIWVWSKRDLMGKVRKDFHTDFQHELYLYEKPKRKGKRKWINGKLVEVIDE